MAQILSRARCARNIFYLSSIAAVSSVSVTVASTILYNKTSNKVDALYWEIEELEISNLAATVVSTFRGITYYKSAIHPKEQSEDCPDKTFIN
ncbi:MAG: hypothetical protein WBA41_23050 [Rivularia sp. (in: cyanobacteria)]